MEIKSIQEYTKKNFGESISMYLKEPWYFEKAYEKIILISLCSLGLWKLIGLLIIIMGG